MSFYMTLPCDASREAHPENRIGKFTTSLAREVILEGEYEVGLSECVIPVPRRSLNFKQPIIYFEEGNGPHHFEIDGTDISTLTDFQDQDLRLPKTKDGKDVFQFSTRDRKIVMNIAPKCVVLFDNETNSSLASLLGFKTGTYGGGPEKYRDYVASKSFGGSGTLFFVYIYCDLVEYSYVGDSMVPCLRTLPVLPGESKAKVLRFENPHYIPVAQSRFSQVSIEIANDQGEEIRFSKGLSLVKLHFRQRKK